MNKEELTNVFKYIVKMCDRLINNGNYEADAYTQDTVEYIAELCNRILDGDYGKLVEVKELQKEPVSKDLEEEIAHISKNEYFNFTDWKSIARHFAQWQKQQIMKDAIDGTAYPDDQEIWCDLDRFNLTEGDKVKLIIIKEG